MVLVLIAIGLTTGCSQTPATQKGSAEIEKSVRQPESIRELSKRWQNDRNIADFLILKDRWIKPGCLAKFAKEVLGEPLSTHQAEDGTQFWLFVKCDAERKQFYSWTLLIDGDGKVTGWHSKGIM
jgi:hypothetical protein